MTSRYVVLLDILGFRDMILNNSHDEMVHLFDNFRIYLQMSIANQKTKLDKNGRSVFDISDSRLNSSIISDSIIFWTNGSDTEDFFELIKVLQRFLSFCHNLPKLYLRGCLTHGDFSYFDSGLLLGKESRMNHPIMLGKALVQAFEIEKELEIAGLVITNEALAAASDNNPNLFDKGWSELVLTGKIFQYKMPGKTSVQIYWTINWTRKPGNPTRQELEDGFSSFNRSVSSSSVQAKINNTLRYFEQAPEIQIQND